MEKMTNEELQRHVLLQQMTKKTNHILHLLLSVATFGLWIPIWIIVSINNRVETNKVLDVANGGKVSGSTKLKSAILVLVIVVLFMPLFVVIYGLFSK